MKRDFLTTAVLATVLLTCTVLLPMAAGAAGVSADPAMTNTQSSAIAKLNELKSLEKQGMITEAQYQEGSQKLLNEITE